MAEEENRKSSISQSRSLAEMATFWNEHDATDFEDQTHAADIQFDLQVRRHYLAIDHDLLDRIRDEATRRGISAESLAHLWLQERLLTQAG